MEPSRSRESHENDSRNLAERRRSTSSAGADEAKIPERRDEAEGDRQMIINLTPHPVTIAGVTFPPDGRVPRVATTTVLVGRLVEDAPGEWVRQHCPDGGFGMPDYPGRSIPFTRVELGEVVDLPEPVPGTWLIVSRMVAEAAPKRDDLFAPGDLVRDEAGRI